MTAPKLTPWFPSNVKPVRVGVYETTGEGRSYQHWNGENWGWCSGKIDSCFTSDEGFTSKYQEVKWRGLAVQPK